MTLKAIGHTSSGLVRQSNQDAFYLDDQRGLWLIADGMGGHKGGEVAATMATQLLPQLVEQGKSITDALYKLHEAVHEQAKANPALQGMGTTVVLAKLLNDSLQLYWIGDSRAYAVRRHTIHQLTQDHSHVARLVEQGLISEKQAQHHPQRHVVTQCIGGGRRQKPQIGFSQLAFSRAQAILLCSDGLYNELSDQQIHTIISQAGSSEDAINQLIKQANLQGGRDNTTAILICDETYWQHSLQHESSESNTSSFFSTVNLKKISSYFKKN